MKQLRCWMFAGFTLLELMIVVFIISILASVVAPKLMRRPEQARLMKVKYDLLMLKNSLDLYRLDHGAYPSTKAGLKALLNVTTQDASYLDALPLDPWGQVYQYTNDKSQITIASLGPATTAPASKAWRHEHLQMHINY